MTSTGPGKLTDHVSLGALTRTVPRFIVDEAIAKSGRLEKRSRSLPAHVVVYFVLALSLFPDGYEEVIRKLVNGLRFARVWSKHWTVPTTSALSQARIRLGEAPLKEIFQQIAGPIASPTTRGTFLGDRRVMAIDGVMIDMPDTKENRAFYSREDDETYRPFPQIRTVALLETGTRGFAGAAMGTIYQGERELAALLVNHVEPDMLITADRGFFSFQLWRTYLSTGADLLWRVSSTLHLPVLKTLPDGSYLSEITNQNARSRTRIPLDKVADPRHATHIPVRVIEYHVEKHTDDTGESETFRLITCILHPDDTTALELAGAYQQRWELESAFKELE